MGERDVLSGAAGMGSSCILGVFVRLLLGDFSCSGVADGIDGEGSAVVGRSRRDAAGARDCQRLLEAGKAISFRGVSTGAGACEYGQSDTPCYAMAAVASQSCHEDARGLQC